MDAAPLPPLDVCACAFSSTELTRSPGRKSNGLKGIYISIAMNAAHMNISNGSSRGGSDPPLYMYKRTDMQRMMIAHQNFHSDRSTTPFIQLAKIFLNVSLATPGQAK